ncbi:SDR family NAD(P)-dependent oxidoreductase [Pseudoblastomonas halimionae]|uniref:SDR family NAD(P)-dependent oxidoreductase n=1 Tax=Alteriqipengyuania halimionae TaxID=1926630 RepID=A0A6I4U1A6_9SPHN|nr:SDR family NAD(P)-dependent oxidoreductase [Alteriqipengyuania halimionae]MXP09668.1 SDR family NAD(P)-dependent oxidoreductase [Alteriqipengyuania halimionae]
MSKKFEGQLALVTGASRGIGAATAIALAAEGAHVVLTARDAKTLEDVEEKIHAAGGSATIAPLDLAEANSIGLLAHSIAERWGKLDMLVINAAYLPMLSPVNDIDQKEFGKAITLNILATQALIGHFDSLLKKAEDGRVVGLTSSVGAEPRAYWSAYASTKAAMENLLQSYAQETAKLTRSVRVAVIDPGRTRTRMRAKAYPGEDPATLKGPEVVAEELVNLLASDFESGSRTVVNSD